MAIFEKVFSWLFKDRLVQGLANNRLFQRFVLRTDEFLNTTGKDAVRRAHQLQENTLRTAKGTFKTLKDSLR